MRKSRFSSTQVALIAATVVLFGVAAVLAALLVSGNPGSSSPPQINIGGAPLDEQYDRDDHAVNDGIAIHDFTVDEPGGHARRVRHRWAGLRRPFRPMRRGELSSGRGPNLPVHGGGV